MTRFILLPFVALLLGAPRAGAIDHKNDAFGIGFTSWRAIEPSPQPSFEVPGFLSARIALKPKLELGGLLAVTRNDAQLTFVPGVRGNYVLKAHENINLYAAAQVSLAFGTGATRNVFAFFLGPGVEFRFADFKQLAFFLDLGISGFVADSFHFASAGALLGNAGFHFYLEDTKPEREELPLPQAK